LQFPDDLPWQKSQHKVHDAGVTCTHPKVSKWR
jgi:hypothetical protein